MKLSDQNTIFNFTLWADFAYFGYIVFGPVVDGMSYPALADGLVFGSWGSAEDGHILHGLTQLGHSDTHTTYRCAAETNSMCSVQLVNLCVFWKYLQFDHETS